MQPLSTGEQPVELVSVSIQGEVPDHWLARLHMRPRWPAWAATRSAAEVRVVQLLVLNVLLQIFDGFATYHGMHLGVQERNPLLRAAFEAWGIGASLLLFKGFCCAALGLVYAAIGSQFATLAFSIVAGVYAVGSLVPCL